MPLTVHFSYQPDLPTTVGTAIRIEPGLFVLELDRALLGPSPAFEMSAAPCSSWDSAPSRSGSFCCGSALSGGRWDTVTGAGSNGLSEGAALFFSLGLQLAWSSCSAALRSRVKRSLPLSHPVSIASVQAESVAASTSPAVVSDDWEVSIYFTAVERYYSGPPEVLRGCPVIDCSNGTADLGQFPRDFIAAVKEEGSGRLTSTGAKSAYLNWSVSIGYWLDNAPRDARGSVLEPYVSAAADPSIAFVSTLRINTCGLDARTGEAVDPAICESITRPTWIVRDRFTVAAVGRHVDLYVGEQDRADFVAGSPRAIHTLGASVSVQTVRVRPVSDTVDGLTGAHAEPARRASVSAIGNAVRSERGVVVALLALAAVIRVAWTLLAAPAPESDFLTFLTTAQLIGQGHWWPDAYGWAWQGPGYPLLIAPLTLLGPASLPAIYALNIALGSAGGRTGLAAGVSDLRVASWAMGAAIAAMFPGLWLWTPIVTAENLSVPILLGIGVLLISSPSGWRLPVIGVLAGLLVFVRPSMLLFVLVVFVGVVWFARSGTKRRSAFTFVASLAILVGGFAILNLRAGGPPLPVGASGWQPWLVYNERATGAWFPAQERDDYPFHGMEADPALAGIVRAGQLKLAIQFAVMNPGAILPGVINRHVNNWRSDGAGLDWTIRRPDATSAAARATIPFGPIVDGFYFAVLGLALIGALTQTSRSTVAFVLLLPIAYLVAPAVIAEGNARYHVNALAFLAILAGGGLAARPAAGVLFAAASVALGLLAPPGFAVAPLLVACILGAGALRVSLLAARAARRVIASTEGKRLVWGTAIALVAVQLGIAVALLTARQAVVDWSLVQPEGWSTYRLEGTAQLPEDGVDVRASDLPAGLPKGVVSRRRRDHVPAFGAGRGAGRPHADVPRPRGRHEVRDLPADLRGEPRHRGRHPGGPGQWPSRLGALARFAPGWVAGRRAALDC